jgi:hypothetical protein
MVFPSTRMWSLFSPPFQKPLQWIALMSGIWCKRSCMMSEAKLQRRQSSCPLTLFLRIPAWEALIDRWKVWPSCSCCPWVHVAPMVAVLVEHCPTALGWGKQVLLVALPSAPCLRAGCYVTIGDWHTWFKENLNMQQAGLYYITSLYPTLGLKDWLCKGSQDGPKPGGPAPLSERIRALSKAVKCHWTFLFVFVNMGVTLLSSLSTGRAAQCGSWPRAGSSRSLLPRMWVQFLGPVSMGLSHVHATCSSEWLQANCVASFAKFPHLWAGSDSTLYWSECCMV